MENNAFNQPQASMLLPDQVRHCLAGRALAGDDGKLRIVAASAQNWPELASLSVDEIALGDDGLVRLALWSASKSCSTLLGTRRATLLVPEGDDMWEIRCIVVANASLVTSRPLSSFLLKPIEIQDGHAARAVGDTRGAHHTRDSQHRADETRLALFDAFPVGQDGEHPPPGLTFTP
ncbi:hypothetical protein [Bradyrhizobium genosp. A]|uniref:hypothetical protein n=1 Tax=Bradyrhizobium genosp. A TaxID=83626 RepID=UPI003CE9814A